MNAHAFTVLIFKQQIDIMPLNNNPNTAPPHFPESWAAEWGEDHYGFWQAFIYKDVRCVFRWIDAGTFLMGSPKNEVDREPWGKETQHKVTLTQGFWIAETAVTQALWQAVMGDNPSRFSDDLNNPVEQVSWDDCQKFIATLSPLLHQSPFSQALKSELHLRLPFEAEWEYACRAGNQTPFSFGENISPDQVNYNGEYPYHKAEKGEYRGETVKVASLPCNAWGLYEMHGNVWEWCEDYYQSDLGSGDVTNPAGATESSERVVRGGSWDNYGKRVRSALRGLNSPDIRGNYLGLRLVVGQSSMRL